MGEIVAGDGARIAFDDSGSGRPLLLLHGWATHAGFFGPQRAGLADGFRVIAVDLRGHGRSRRPAERPTIEQLADDLRTLLDTLGLEDALAVGWSMGAMVLWRALLDGAAPRLAGMVVVDMAPRVLNADDWTLGLPGSQSRRPTAQVLDAMAADWAALVPRVARRLFAAGLETERADLTAWAAAQIRDNDPAAMAALWGSLTAQDFRARLPGLTLPTLIASGALSRLYPPQTAVWLEAALGGAARRVTFARSGHAPHLEEPELFNRTIRDFAAGLPLRGSQRAG